MLCPPKVLQNISCPLPIRPPPRPQCWELPNHVTFPSRCFQIILYSITAISDVKIWNIMAKKYNFSLKDWSIWNVCFQMSKENLWIQYVPCCRPPRNGNILLHGVLWFWQRGVWLKYCWAKKFYFLLDTENYIVASKNIFLHPFKINICKQIKIDLIPRPFS